MRSSTIYRNLHIKWFNTQWSPTPESLLVCQYTNVYIFKFEFKINCKISQLKNIDGGDLQLLNYRCVVPTVTIDTSSF